MKPAEGTSVPGRDGFSRYLGMAMDAKKASLSSVEGRPFLFFARLARHATQKPQKEFQSRGWIHMKKLDVRKWTISALLLALCMVLPFLTGQIPQIGSALAPMHIPVLLCGFLCGWPYGLLVGFIAPLLRGLIFGMPPFFPTGVAMAFELAVYGLVSGLLYKLLPQKRIYLYVSLVTAMLAGRVAWGIVRVVIAGLGSAPFSYAMFMAGAFTNAIPGIICHIALIPLIVMALERAKLIPRPQTQRVAGQ